MDSNTYWVEKVNRCDHQYKKICGYLTELTEFTPHYGGSAAKRTSVTYHEIDVFLEHNSADLSKLRNALQNLPVSYSLTIHKRHHEYYTLRLPDDFSIDVVPIDNSDPRSTMAASIKHVNYVLANMSEAKRKEVVELKKILMAADLYGSTDARGLSGFVTELLILKFGNVKTMKENPSAVYDYLVNEIRDPVDNRRQITKSYRKDICLKFIFVLSNGVLDVLSAYYAEGFCVIRYPYEHALYRKLCVIRRVAERMLIPLITVTTKAYVYAIYRPGIHERYKTTELDYQKADINKVLESAIVYVSDTLKTSRRYSLALPEDLPPGQLVTEAQIDNSEKRIINVSFKTTLRHISHGLRKWPATPWTLADSHATSGKSEA